MSRPLNMSRLPDRHLALHLFRHILLGLAIGTVAAITAFGPLRALAQAANEPGKFDFYVLALSWSPTFCEASRERYGSRRPSQQCSSAQPHAFVVHGLWPQFEHGFPAKCQVPAPRLDRRIVDSMLELMPSPRLVYSQWDRHGTCTGLAAAGYFEAVRKARATVNIPAEYQSVGSALTVSPEAVAQAFVKANPGLTAAGVAVMCDSRRLSEVRVCLSRDLAFRDCGEVARRACRRDSVVMPALRSERAADAR